MRSSHSCLRNNQNKLKKSNQSAQIIARANNKLNKVGKVSGISMSSTMQMKMNIWICIVVQLFLICPVHGWVDHYDEGEDDAKVVKIFLPLIACAILTCIGGCYFKKHCEKPNNEDGDA